MPDEILQTESADDQRYVAFLQSPEERLGFLPEPTEERVCKRIQTCKYLYFVPLSTFKCQR